MGTHGRLAEDELLGDLGIRAPREQQREYVCLARREAGDLQSARPRQGLEPAATVIGHEDAEVIRTAMQAV